MGKWIEFTFEWTCHIFIYIYLYIFRIKVIPESLTISPISLAFAIQDDGTLNIDKRADSARFGYFTFCFDGFSENDHKIFMEKVRLTGINTIRRAHVINESHILYR